MPARLSLAVWAVCLLFPPALAADDRNWQIGVWADLIVTRPRIVFGLQPSPFRPGPDPTRRMTEVRTYVIETRDRRIELKETVPPDGPPLEPMLGTRVRFAVEKKTVYILERDGTERKLRVSKTTSRLR